ncbi:hypothetical protein XYCOK13_26050 [Xylanibacillus composti]|uniref:Microcin J25-processing protein McjB C-terminal domain-containing protein n=2 Tax=Xylanibacillus composti TaxID=1572762 RepID=A0A8J4H5A8_9BACL|nr:hypothetical protein XYCOK13_26050 [Xylanibacillus composti]
MGNKMRTFLSLPMRQKLLYIEAFYFLGWARVFKMLPFSKVAPALGVYMQETPYTYEDAHVPVIVDVSRAVRTMSRYTWWESRCLVMAIAAMKMLERRGVACTLYMGTAKDENGRMIAHAWLRSGRRTLTGAEGKERFTVVGKFAKYVQVR